jgi:hypothetical protein
MPSLFDIMQAQVMILNQLSRSRKVRYSIVQLHAHKTWDMKQETSKSLMAHCSV